MTMVNNVTKCNLCNEKGFDVIYDDQIRDGIVGKITKIKHKVVKCHG